MTCKLDECEYPVYCKGWCRKHYNSWWAHGDPLAAKPRETYAKRGTPLKLVTEGVPIVSALLWLSGHYCCIEWPLAKVTGGYGIIYPQQRVSHLILDAMGKTRPPQLIAMHSCDNPPCCAPWHLSWGTVSHNAMEAWIVGSGRNQYTKI